VQALNARSAFLCLTTVAMATACSAAPSTVVKASARRGSTASAQIAAPTWTTVLPDVVDGIPLRELADQARAIAAGWSELHPWNMRAAMGNAYLAHSLEDVDGMTYHYGSTTPAYVVALDGRFTCQPPACAGSEPSRGVQTCQPTTTTSPSPVPISTMVFTVDIGAVGDRVLIVMNHEADMTGLGRVYPLDGYP